MQDDKTDEPAWYLRVPASAMLSTLLPGDILLVAGDKKIVSGVPTTSAALRFAQAAYRIASRREVSYFKSLYSHAALSLGGGVIIDANPAVGVRSRTIQEFLQGVDIDTALVLRPDRRMERQEIERLFRAAAYYSGQHYNYLFLIKPSQVHERNASFCSQLIARVYARLGYQEFAGLHYRILPIDLPNLCAPPKWQHLPLRPLIAWLSDTEPSLSPDTRIPRQLRLRVQAFRAGMERDRRKTRAVIEAIAGRLAVTQNDQGTHGRLYAELVKQLEALFSFTESNLRAVKTDADAARLLEDHDLRPGLLGLIDDVVFVCKACIPNDRPAEPLLFGEEGLADATDRLTAQQGVLRALRVELTKAELGRLRTAISSLLAGAEVLLSVQEQGTAFAKAHQDLLVALSALLSDHHETLAAILAIDDAKLRRSLDVARLASAGATAVLLHHLGDLLDRVEQALDMAAHMKRHALVIGDCDDASTAPAEFARRLLRGASMDGSAPVP